MSVTKVVIKIFSNKKNMEIMKKYSENPEINASIIREKQMIVEYNKALKTAVAYLNRALVMHRARIEDTDAIDRTTEYIDTCIEFINDIRGERDLLK